MHKDNGGTPGKVVGCAPVKAATISTGRVTLNPAPKAGDKFWPMLHVDVGEKGKDEFPGADAPVVANGMPVMMDITILVGASTALPNTGAGNGLIALLAGAALLLRRGGLARTRTSSVPGFGPSGHGARRAHSRWPGTGAEEVLISL